MLKNLRKVMLLAALLLTGTGWAITQEDGVYQLKTAADFKAFADMINSGQTDINAVLTADIDFTGYNMSIGTSNTITYKGTLDGQGHKITIKREGGNGLGLFEYCGGLIKNLIVDGEIISTGEHNGGIVGDARQGLTVENCISYVNITSTRDTNVGSGGILGNVGGSRTKLINCIYAGHIKANDRIGGFVGWYDDPNNTIENCLMIGTVDVGTFEIDETNELASNVICRYGTHPIRCSISNTYYVRQDGVPDQFYVGRQGEVMGNSNGEDNISNMTQGAFEVTKAQVESGEVCFKMNQNAAPFTQTIGQDAHPFPFDTHSPVAEVSGIYCNVDENGNICIGTPEQFKTFGDLINSGQTEINAVLTADIDFTGYNMSIGNSNTNTYKGTLDGQGHKITIKREGGNGLGLFEYCGGLIKNLIVDGTINSTGEHNGGIVGDARQGLTLENCISYVNIVSTRDTNVGSGGILGNVGGSRTKLLNCIYAGNIKANDRIGGFVGWYDDPNNTIENCLMIGTVDVGTFEIDATNELASNVICRYGTHPIRCSISNTYYVRQDGVPDQFYVGRQGEVMGSSNGEDNISNMTQGAFEVTWDQVQNGEVCYKMNEKAGEGNAFTQNIGSDKFPLPFNTQSPVFLVDGKYSNTDEEGYLYISTAEQFKAFADRINSGETEINAKLTADIDFTGYNMSIGTSNTITYKGTLDGQGHKITIYREGGNGLGLFEYCGGLIKNLIVDGTINSTGEHNGGIVGDARQGLTVENCISYVNITSTRDTNVGSGGILGNVGGSRTKLLNCIYAGTIKANDRIGGFVGWYDDPNNTIENCLMIGTVDVGTFEIDETNELASNVICRYGTHPIRCSISNTYYVRQDGVPDQFYVGRQGEVMGSSNGEDNINNMTQGAFEVTMAQVKSGEVCYKLNGDQSTIGFWQAIGEDQMPLPFEKEDAQVYLKEGTYTNSDAYMIATAEDFKAFADLINSGQTEINAKLTADIDFTGYNMSIGTSNTITYKGTLDGQGHKITIKREGGNGLGLFEYCGGLIKNLIVDGEIISTGEHNGGIVGDARQGLTVENCISYVNITSTRDTNVGSGGILGNVGGSRTKLLNCIYAGTIKANDRIGGFVGWYDDPNNVIENCLMIGTVDVGTFEIDETNELASNVICRYGTHPIRCSIRNTYYVRQDGVPDQFYVGRQGEVMGDSNGEDNISNMTQGAFEVTKEQLASGEVTFALNNNQQTINFYQTIGTDEVPTILSNGHKRVYANGQVKCNGIKYGDATYSNFAPNLIDSHVFEDGVCVVCGATEGETELEIDEEGYYLIASAPQFRQFCELVNDKNQIEAKGRLVADIDLSDEKYAKTRLGAFAGEFDGQGHIMTVAWNLTGGAGLVEALRGEVHDVILRGTMTNSQSYMGGIAGATVGARIRNCVVELAITSTYNGHNGSVEGGGIIGRNEGANTLVENCLFAGKLIQGENEDANLNAIGGIQGNNRGSIIIRNCIVTGTVEARSTDAAVFARSGQATVTNSYYVDASTFPGGTAGYGTQISQEELNTGGLTYTLNGGNINPATVVWRQNTYEYEPSVPMPTGGDKYGIVYRLNDGRYMGVYDNESMNTFQYAFQAQETDYMENVVANAEVIDEYMPHIDELMAITDYKEFWYAYVEFNAKKQALVDNVNAYAEYFEQVEEARQYLIDNQLTGENAEILDSYVNANVAPGDQFANGSASYIEENLQLGTEAVRNEIDFLNNLRGNAIKEGYLPGTDITLLLTNGDFRNRFNGWGGNGGTGTYSSLKPAVVEAWNGTLDRYQTITGLKNGVYELQLNGLFRAAGNDHNTSYAAYVYAYSGEDKNWTPFMSIGEGALPAGEAKNMENCYIVNVNTAPYDNEFQFVEDGEYFYVPNSVDGASYAFKGGRYLNRVLVNVTDGSLHVGVFVPGTGAANDWAPFGGTKLIYHGELDSETATESLDNTLAGLAARAETAIAFEPRVDEYVAWTGYSQQEKNELQACIDAWNTVSTNAEKYDLVKRFSAVFQSIKDTKEAYKYMVQMSNVVLEAAGNLGDAISQADLVKIVNATDAVNGGFETGAYTAEEARALKEFEGMVPAQDENGVYQIGTPMEFAMFGEFVRQINNNISAKQTADIEGVNFAMGLTDFGGTYDGDFHTLTLDMNTDQEWASPFRATKGSALIKNVVTRGTINTSAMAPSGLVGSAGGNTRIQNCESYVVINTSVQGDATAGGLIGRAEGGTVTMTNAMFAGSINGEAATCCAGISGWISSGNLVMNNVLMVGEINALEEGSATFCRNSGAASMTNCYFKEGVMEIEDNGKGTKVTADQLASGEIAYKLNGEKQGEGVAWYQKVGTDAIPTIVPNNDNIVYMQEDGSFSNVPTAIESIAAEGEGKAVIYDLTGRRVEKARKGLYIINGKKVLVK